LRSELANLSSATLRNTTLDIGNTAETNKENIQILNSRIDRTNEAYANFNNVKETKNALNSFNGELEQIKNENSGIQQNFSDLPSKDSVGSKTYLLFILTR
jgi:predicted  nucleic acid-binding Zn-ribbon protein